MRKKRQQDASLGLMDLTRVKDGIADGVYVYTLHIDYGTNARACSERFVVKVCGNSAQLCAIRRNSAQFGAIL